MKNCPVAVTSNKSIFLAKEVMNLKHNFQKWKMYIGTTLVNIKDNIEHNKYEILKKGVSM